MRVIVEEGVYESPRVKVIEVEVEQGFAISGDDDGKGTGDDYTGGWG